MSGKIIYNGKEYTGEVLNNTGVGEFTTNGGKKNPTGVNSEIFNTYGGQYPNVASGNYSHAEGQITQASGNYSHAEGQNTQANGDYSHAEGSGTIASGNYSHAEGGYTQATAKQAHAEGDSTVASGRGAHAEGSNTQAINEEAHAEGDSTIASGLTSHAEGANTQALGMKSHAEGEFCIAGQGQLTAIGAHAEGYHTIAYGNQGSHAEGSYTIASQLAAHAEGENTVASGSAAHAEGSGTEAQGPYSHAGGYKTLAKEYGSTAIGTGTIASRNNSVALGEYNIDSQYNIIAVGGGSQDTTDGYSYNGVTLEFYSSDMEYSIGDMIWTSTSSSFDPAWIEVVPTKAVFTAKQSGELVNPYRDFMNNGKTLEGMTSWSLLGEAEPIITSHRLDILEFNIYKDLILNTGHQVTVGSVTNSIIGGEGNTVNKGTDSIIYGKTIKANQYADYSIISGYNHTLRQINCSEVSGLNNTVTGADYSIIGGQDHTIGSLNSSLITGVRHTIVDAGNYDSCTGNIVGGYENYLEGDYSLLSGHQNKMWNPEQSVSELQGNFISGYYNQAWGSYNSITGMGLITLGNAAHAEGYGTAGNKNYSDVHDVVEAIGAYPKGSGSTWINQWLTDFDNYCSEQGITDDTKTDLLLRCKLVAEGGSQSVSQIIPITGGYQAQISGNYRGIAIGIGAHVEGEYCNAHGYGAHAEGMWGVALSSASHAEGFITIAYGEGSHVEGKYNQIGIGLQDNWKLPYQLYNVVDSTKTWYANCAHVEGQYNVVTTGSGTFAHLEGYANGVVNSADYAHIEGGQNTAINPGPSIHIEGNSNLVYGKSSSEGSAYSHIEGGYNMMAKSPYSHMEGYGSRLYSSTASHLESYYGFIYDSNYSHLENSGIFSVSNFDQIIGSKAETSDAYRLASYFDILQDPSRANRHMDSDTDTLDNSIISSNCSHAEGNCVIIYSSPNSHIEGTSIADTTNKILYRHSIDGYSYGSHAEGGGNYITDGSIYSHIEGYLNQINSGSGYSHVEGAENYLTNGSSYSHIEGYRVYVGGSAYATHVEGTGIRIKDFTIPNVDITTELQNQRNNVIENRTILTDKVVWTYEHCVRAACSHLEGFKNLIGMGATISHVEGTYNCVSGSLVNHIEGAANYIIESSYLCHIEGQNNSISGSSLSSHIEGGYNVLSNGSQYNHAEGYKNIITNGSTQSHIQGAYNIIKDNPSTAGSHVEGLYNIIAQGSRIGHIEGCYNSQLNSSTNNHIEGEWNSATNGPVNSHIEGKNVMITNGAQSSHAEGYGNENDTSIDNIYQQQFIGNISRIRSTYSSGGVPTINYTYESKTYYHLIDGCNYSHIEGLNNIISNSWTESFGPADSAPSSTSHAEGQYNLIFGKANHAEGSANLVGYQILIEDGTSSIPTYKTYRSAYSHAEGRRNMLRGAYAAHIEGLGNSLGEWIDPTYDETDPEAVPYTDEMKYSYGAHAEGNYNVTRGEASHVQGLGNIANAQAQTVLGKYNVEDISSVNAKPEGTYAVIVGNGTAAETEIEAYDATATYAIDDQVIYEGKAYKCIEAIAEAEDFDSTKWTELDIELINNKEVTRSNAATLTWDGYLDVSGGFSVNGTPIGGASGDIANPNISDEYSSFSTYNVGEYCIYNNILYKCNTAITVGETFDSTKWTATTIGSELLAIISRVSALETALNGYSFANTMTEAEYEQITPDTNTIYPVVEE